jgi:hypothetical protein
MHSCRHREGKCSGPHILHQGSGMLTAEDSSKSSSEMLNHTIQFFENWAQFQKLNEPSW